MNTQQRITYFRGEWTRLSNYSLVSIWYEGHIYASVEHAYQAAKSLDEEERREIRNAPTPQLSKKLGRKVTLRSDWDEVKIPIMRELLKEKFSQLPEKQVLLSTGDRELVEGNWWKDTFWGQCPIGNGENWLGRLLMELREELRGLFTALTISQVVDVAWLPVLKTLRKGQPWHSPVLNKATLDGSLVFMPLGAQVEDAGTGKKYDIQQVTVPTTWTANDEIKHDTPEKKISLVKQLLENTVYSHEDLLESILEKSKKLLVSKDYYMQKGAIQPIINQSAYYFMTYTDFVSISKEKDLLLEFLVSREENK